MLGELVARPHFIEYEIKYVKTKPENLQILDIIKYTKNASI